jgi:membrane-associated protease RseP (regulator of RpoE activity)
MVSQVAESLVTTGKVVHGYLGINIQSITPSLKDSFNLKDMRGALVAQVTPESPASRAGIKEGDVVTAVDGHAVKDANDLALAVSGKAPGIKLALDVTRDGKTMTLDATTGTNPDAHLASAEVDNGGNDQGVLNGVGVEDLSKDTRAQFNIPEHLLPGSSVAEQVTVNHLVAGSIPARAAISAKDLVNCRVALIPVSFACMCVGGQQYTSRLYHLLPHAYLVRRNSKFSKTEVGQNRL